jgi:hypothetical protein
MLNVCACVCARAYCALRIHSLAGCPDIVRNNCERRERSHRDCDSEFFNSRVKVARGGIMRTLFIWTGIKTGNNIFKELPHHLPSLLCIAVLPRKVSWRNEKSSMQPRKDKHRTISSSRFSFFFFFFFFYFVNISRGSVK